MPARATILLIISIMGSMMAGVAIAEPANNGIWLQSANSGNQAWAYYPYDPAQPFSGGSYSATNTGTSYFTVTPGTTIQRKYIVLNNEPYNDSVSYQITGLPSDWGLSYTTSNPLVISYVYNPSVGQGAQNSHQGFGSMVVSIPSSAAPGTYSYTIHATSGTGYTSSLTDRIIVGAGEVAPTPTPTPTPTSTPSPTPTAQPGINTPTPVPAQDLTPTPSPSPTQTPTPASFPAISYSNPSGLSVFVSPPTPTPPATATVTADIMGSSNATLVPAVNDPVDPVTPAPSQDNDIVPWLAGMLGIVLLVAIGYQYYIRK